MVSDSFVCSENFYLSSTKICLDETECRIALIGRIGGDVNYNHNACFMKLTWTHAKSNLL